MEFIHTGVAIRFNVVSRLLFSGNPSEENKKRYYQSNLMPRFSKAPILESCQSSLGNSAIITKVYRLPVYFPQWRRRSRGVGKWWY